MAKVNEFQSRIIEMVFGKEEEAFEPLALTEEELRELAVHEAGHCVTFLALNVNYAKLICVTIIQTQEHLGSNLYRYSANIERDERYYKEMIALNIAGKIASDQMGFKPRFYEKDLLEAYELADEYVKKYCPSGNFEEDRNRILKVIAEQKETVLKIIKENEKQLNDITKALLKRKVLLAAEAKALFDGTMTIEELEPMELN